MKNLNLTAYGVAAMSEAQMREVDGGCWICAAIDAVASFLKGVFCRD